MSGYNPKNPDAFDQVELPAPVPPPLNIIPAPGGSILEDGAMASPNYKRNISGWILRADGSAEFNAGIAVLSIDIPDTTTAASFHVDSSGNLWIGATTFAGAPFSVSNTGALTATSATIAGYVVQSQGTFGGDGSDGALSISSGTTTLSIGSSNVLVKNYTSISVTSTGKLAFSNPASTGSIVFLRSQGDVTVTSTATCIDASSIGSSGGTGATSTGAPVSGSNGTDTTNWMYATIKAGGGGVNSVGGAAGAVPTFGYYSSISDFLLVKYHAVFCGAGGGGGAANASTNAVGGNGGRGGGGLVIECGGAWNFTTASGISVAGGTGNNGTDNGALNNTGAGGGGGGAGCCFILYGSLTANSGTIVISGGTGGNNSPVAGNGQVYGGGGGGSIGAGTASTQSSSGSAKTGGDGATGYSLVALNKVF